MAPTTLSSGVNDFDFFIGGWRVKHRRLKERLAASNEWVEFEGTSTVWKILGGFGNIDDNVIDLSAGTYRAANAARVRSGRKPMVDLVARQSQSASSRPPVVGRFENGVGTFGRHLQGKTDSRTLSMDGGNVRHAALGAGVFAGWRY
jgi:hypothetical protein